MERIRILYFWPSRLGLIVLMGCNMPVAIQLGILHTNGLSPGDILKKSSNFMGFIIVAKVMLDQEWRFRNVFSVANVPVADKPDCSVSENFVRRCCRDDGKASFGFVSRNVIVVDC